MDDDVLLNLAGTGEDGALPARPRGAKNTWAQRLERRRGRPVSSRSAECLRSNCSLRAQQRCRAAGARPAQRPARQGWAGQGGGAAGTPGATAQGLRPGGRARRAAGAATAGARSAQHRACRRRRCARAPPQAAARSAQRRACLRRRRACRRRRRACAPPQAAACAPGERGAPRAPTRERRGGRQSCAAARTCGGGR